MHSAPTYDNFMRRLGAAMIDTMAFLFIYVLCLLLLMAFLDLRRLEEVELFEPYGFILDCIYFSYHCLMVKKYGATLGKMLFKIHVTSLTGARVTWRQAALRALGAIAFYLLPGQVAPFLWEKPLAGLLEALEPALAQGLGVKGVFLGVGVFVLVLFWVALGLCDYLAYFFNKKRQTLHDIIAGTVVVRP